MKNPAQLLKENSALKARLAEADELLAAIKSGSVDAFVTDDQKVFTLTTADHPYRILVETINEGAATLKHDGTIMYCNNRLATMIKLPMETIVGRSVFDVFRPDDRQRLRSILSQSRTETTRTELRIKQNGGRLLPVLVSCVSLKLDEVGLCMVVTDLSELKKAESRKEGAEEDLRRSRERLRALAAHLQSVREEERIQIARELHDDLGQVLTALKMDIGLLKKGLYPGNKMPRRKLIREIASMGRLVDRTILAVHKITTELRPSVLNHLNLKDALEWQIQEFGSQSGIACELCSNLSKLELDRKSTTALFRIFQETLINVANHAKASHVRIMLEEEDDILTMEVSDNGKGITEDEISDAKSFGLLGIKERALLLGGEVQVSGAPGVGTTVTLRVPLAGLRLPGVQ